MDFITKIKKELQPDTSVLVEIELFLKEINIEIKNNKIKAKCVKGGSVAKGTFIKGDFDIDLFVKFDYKEYKDFELSDLLEPILEKFSPQRVHGSRDYFKLKQGKFNYEIVPVLDVTNPEKHLNVTDMSPMHVDWVKKNLKKGQADEIRLAKKFCKAIGTYGAESYISGFSGHVLDILVIHYGSFEKLLIESKKWDKKTIIDAEKYFKNKMDVMFNLNQSKIQGPLIVIDPILKTRNAASALSYEKFKLFKDKAKDFLKKPSPKYFEEIIIGKTHLKSMYKKNLSIITLEAKTGKQDVIGSKILKAFKYLKSGLKKVGFDITDSGWSWNKSKKVLYWFVVKQDKLPYTRIIEGPPLDKTKGCDDFKNKYDNTYVENERLFTKEKIKSRLLEENIKTISNNDYFKNKIKLIKIEN